MGATHNQPLPFLAAEGRPPVGLSTRSSASSWASVTLYDEVGAAEVCIEDGGLFAGHWVVSIGDGVPLHATLGG